MRARSVPLLAAVVLVVVTSAARAEPEAAVWLECRAPRGLPLAGPLRLSCKIDQQSAVEILTVLPQRRAGDRPRYWQTVDPFSPFVGELADPFYPVAAALVDPFERGSYARSFADRELADPFGGPVAPSQDDDPDAAALPAR